MTSSITQDRACPPSHGVTLFERRSHVEGWRRRRQIRGIASGAAARGSRSRGGPPTGGRFVVSPCPRARSISDRPVDPTFLVADLAAYIALTEAHGDDQAADAALGFNKAVPGRGCPITPPRR